MTYIKNASIENSGVFTASTDPLDPKGWKFFSIMPFWEKRGIWQIRDAVEGML